VFNVLTLVTKASKILLWWFQWRLPSQLDLTYKNSRRSAFPACYLPLKMRGFSEFLAISGYKRLNCDAMDGDRPRLPANRNCYRLSRVSRAL